MNRFSGSLRRAVPPALRPIARGLLQNLSIESAHSILVGGPAENAPPGEIPVPPAILRFRVSELLPPDEFLWIGAGGANLIRRHAAGMGVDFAKAHRVLDFGCGCGRTIRWFLHDGGATEFHGVDVDAGAIDWCNRHLRGGHFLHTAPTPPLPYPAEYFGVAYCFSVFTHLNEPMQDLWLAELSRILTPGGVLLITVFGEAAANALDAEGREALAVRGSCTGARKN